MTLLQLPFQKIILGSQSPRRKELLAKAGLNFEVMHLHADESFPEMNAKDVAPFLAAKKADSFTHLNRHTLLITCDTTVVLNEEVINKPVNLDDASQMLLKLSGKCHTVVSGVCLSTMDKRRVFTEETLVYFKTLSIAEIEHYLKNAQVLDKAGSYGIQDWIGLIGVQKIEGCFYNVMGLPVSRLYSELKLWTQAE